MTLSPAVELTGQQTPRVLFRPPFVTERRGEEAIELAAQVGLKLDPWQQLAVKVALAEREDGKFAASEVAALVARQQGKGAILEAIELESLFLQGDPLVIHSAHQFKTSTEAFLRIRGWIDGSDWLRSKVKRVVAAHGDEGIELKSGPRLRFIARSKSSGRGFSPQRIIWDESQELSVAALDAMKYAMRAQANRQSVFVGTVPGPDNNHPEVWTGLRNRGRAGTGSRLAWMEWSPEGSEDPETASTIRLDDLDVIRASNPALGYRVPLETILDEFESASTAESRAGFAREALSIWPTLPEEDLSGPIDLERWALRRNEKGKPPAKERPVALGVEVSAGRASATIAVAGPARKGDRTTVLVLTKPGVDWVVGKLTALLEKKEVLGVSVDPGGPTSSILADIQAAGLELDLATVRTLGHATGGFVRAVDEGTVEHHGQAELDEAVKGARVRMVGDVEVWDRKEARTDIAPLIAASLALQLHTLNAADDYNPLDSIG